MVFEFCSRERERLTGAAVDFDHAYDRYFPAFEDGICGGTCARLSVSAEADEYAPEEFA
ncbi:hypothetical protein RvVAT039_pl13110 (plasmid) [Agrobacterium vitis]|uniref:hypothetical protein n=1 Tax=Agrobacterium vitis TaxID=373 RepID=UPI0015DC0F7A|nr:hypothetical protein [Agrobacterium vitis]BCH68478.1 hypothetical protein RvVAT039_pl13110 [Agrobacterium vitis]